MKVIKHLYFYLFLFAAALSYSQSSGIKGLVIDDLTGQPLPSATVTIKTLNISRVSDSEGNFIFSKIAPGIYDIKITCYTFQPKEITEVVGISKAKKITDFYKTN